MKSNHPGQTDQLDMPAVLSAASLRRIEARANAKARHFVRGPIPMGWLERAARLPGKAFAVGVLLWFQRGIAPHRPVRLTHVLLDRFGVDRKAGYRAVRSMEAAGLIRADRSYGRCALITVLVEPAASSKG